MWFQIHATSCLVAFFSLLSKVFAETCLTSTTDLQIRINRIYKDTFKVQQYLGKGAYGKVFLIESTSGKSIAVKVLLKSKYIKEVANEINVCELIGKECQYLPEYYGAVIGERNVYMFLEYIPIGSLHDFSDYFSKQRKRVSLNVLRQATKHLLIALSYLHKINIAHNDVHGGNILFNAQGEFKLIDFGRSFVTSDHQNDENPIFTHLARDLMARAQKNRLKKNQTEDICKSGMMLSFIADLRRSFWAIKSYLLQSPFDMDEINYFGLDFMKFLISCFEDEASAKSLISHPWTKQYIDQKQIISEVENFVVWKEKLKRKDEDLSEIIYQIKQDNTWSYVLIPMESEQTLTKVDPRVIHILSFVMCLFIYLFWHILDF